MTTAEMLSIARVLRKENFVSIRDLQKSPTKSLTSTEWMKFIINNWKPMGVYIDYSDWEELFEDLEALKSEKYLKKIEESRKDKNIYSREDVIKKFNLSI